MIRLRNVTVARGATPLAADLSVDIEPGRIWWVVGPNGAGKSTLLRVIAELDPPRAGTVSVLPGGARVLYFASSVTLPPTSTVADWDRLLRRLDRGTDRSGRSRRPGASGRTAIWPEVPGRRRVSRLSTGERKRLLLDALLRQSGPMVLDEPFEHLSPDAKEELQRLLEARALEHVVVVATNQAVSRAEYRGLRLRGGTATRLAPGPAGPATDSPAPAAHRGPGGTRVDVARSAVSDRVTAAIRTAAMASFAIRANLRGGLALGGLLMALVVMLVGPAVAMTRGLAWSFDPQFGFFGFLVLALFTIRSGYQEQRELGMAEFFRRNFVGAMPHALAMVASALSAWAVVCATGFLAILAISAGELGTAGWYTASWGLRTLPLVGLVPLVEHTASFRLPFLLPALAYVVLLVALTIVLPEGEAIALFVPTPPGETEALTRLAVQAGILVPAATAAFLVLVAAGGPLRRKVRKLASQRSSHG